MRQRLSTDCFSPYKLRAAEHTMLLSRPHFKDTNSLMCKEKLWDARVPKSVLSYLYNFNHLTSSDTTDSLKSLCYPYRRNIGNRTKIIAVVSTVMAAVILLLRICTRLTLANSMSPGIDDIFVFCGWVSL